MASSGGGVVLEGFLCPICVHDLGSVAELKDHFEVAHAGEDKALLNQLKGLFGKAKKALLRQEIESTDGLSPMATGSPAGGGGAGGGDSIVSGSLAAMNLTDMDPSQWEPQELGVTRSLTDAFRSVRESRIDRFVIETNKLLIRLDKLVNTDLPADPGKRKAFERTVVTWAPDADVSLCMTCGKAFSLVKRRHHCRLCGRILCNKCSHFLPADFARKLTNPAVLYEGEGFHRSGSNSSLNSSFSPEGDAQIRTCAECRFLLERRDEQATLRNTKPTIVIIYERIRVNIEQVETIVPEYTMMANSLNSGDTSYSLAEAQNLRMQLTKLYESLSALSKRTLTLDDSQSQPGSASQAPPPKSLRLRQMIAASTSAFLQETVLGLPPLPSPEELEKLIAVNRAAAQSRIAEERRRVADRDKQRRERGEAARTGGEQSRRGTLGGEVKYRADDGGEKVDLTGGGGSEVEGGWKPAVSARVRDVNEDPMVQQMNIIRGYIGEARGAGRWDELVMLEDNLKELQGEYWRQQQQQ